MEQFHPGPLERLLAKPDLSLKNTRPEGSVWQAAVCACGDLEGAAYYACWHNRSAENDTPVLIEFEAEVDDVAVDGRDFLYTVFQLGDPERARGPLHAVFGPRVLRYAEKAWASPETDARIAFCDLAIHDPEIVRAHHENRLVIAGRHRTKFRSAFTVRLPVTSAAIRSVWVLPELTTLPTSDISLDDVRTLRRY